MLINLACVDAVAVILYFSISQACYCTMLFQ